MRVLLTGAAGQLGSEVARQLAPHHEVIGLDLQPGEWTTVVGSVFDRALMDALTKQAEAIIHTASLHAPHVATLTKEQFVDVNIKGALYLLEAAVAHNIRRFIYTSTTSIYGAAMEPRDQAVWVTEELVPQPRDIYDITKLAAEQLCQHFAATHDLPIVCLRTSRFWNEAPPLKAIYRLYRGVDVRDAAAAHLLALQNEAIRFGVFNISAASPFAESDTVALFINARDVIRRHFPHAERVLQARQWALPKSIDRVYVIEKAQRLLSYQPQFNFAELLQQLANA